MPCYQEAGYKNELLKVFFATHAENVIHAVNAQLELLPEYVPAQHKKTDTYTVLCKLTLEK